MGLKYMHLMKYFLILLILNSLSFIALLAAFESNKVTVPLSIKNAIWSRSAPVNKGSRLLVYKFRSDFVPDKIKNKENEEYYLQKNLNYNNETYDTLGLSNFKFHKENLFINKSYDEHFNQNTSTSSHVPLNTLDEKFGSFIDKIDYPLNTTHSKTIEIQAKTIVQVFITSIDKNYADFLVVQVHSQIFKIILSFDKVPKKQNYVNNTNTGLVVFLQKATNHSSDPSVYVHNYHSHALSVLLIVRNYTNQEPIPGGLYISNSTQSETVPQPYLFLTQNLLTTWISFPLASLDNISYVGPHNSSSRLKVGRKDIEPTPVVPSKAVKYDVYLTYMYEGDLFEEHFWEIIIKTSTLEGLIENSKKVLETYPLDYNWLHTLFVSYSGVGAVVNVVASFNDSKGVLYSSNVFYGCDFFDEEKYNCTKLVSPLAKLFCASLPFLGFILLFFGHRWLNMTMFVAGFLAWWLILFVIFIHVPDANSDVLGICSLCGALGGGVGWLVLWHKFHRPFYSALLLILLSSLFTAMISTHFLKYALVPTRHSMAAFVVFPVAFSATVIAYAIFDIKKVHIFSCCLLGSYGVVVPFAFYLGSSLTYIVINVVSAMTIPHFSEVIGYPPFQYCDIALLCVWVIMFSLGTGYQTYRERSGPPFYPPNLSSLRSVLAALRILKEKASLCLCRLPSDDDSLFEDRPSLRARVAALCSSERSDRERLSAYESFPRIGSDDDGTSLKEVFLGPLRRVRDALRHLVARVRDKAQGSEPLREEVNSEGGGNDGEPLEVGAQNEEMSRETELEADLSRSPLR